MTPDPRTGPVRDGDEPHAPAFTALPADGGTRTGAGWHRTRPGSVWPVALEEDHPDAGVLPGWLLGAVVKIVALYTAPGERVLLLAPPIHRSEYTAHWLTRAGQESGSGLLTGLIDAAQTAARLGRTIQVRPVRIAHGPRFADGGRLVGPESVHRLPPQSADPAPTPADPTGDKSPTAVGPDRFHAVISFVDPRAADWVTGIAWSDLLAPDGTLAFVTHSDHHEGRLIDPSSLLVHTAHHAGLAPLDHVALLEAPIRHSALTVPPGTGAARRGHLKTGLPGTRDTRIHSDLYLYAAPRSGCAAETGEAH